MKRTQWYTGVWEEVTDGLSMACCSCGYTHQFRFKIVGTKVFIIAHLDRRATAQLRRHRRFECVLRK